MTYPMTVVDTIYKALQPAIPDRVIAGHHADLVTSAIHGINPRTREFFIGGLGPLGGGWGAKLTEDGMSATVCANDGDTHNSPNEQSEAKFPIVVERCALIPDSGGAGRYRGGLGIETVVRARSNLVVNTQTDRAHCKPWGLDGGLEATGNQIQLRANGVWKTDQPNAKLLVTQLKPGDAYRLRSGRGSGAKSLRRGGRRRNLRHRRGGDGSVACVDAAIDCAALHTTEAPFVIVTAQLWITRRIDLPVRPSLPANRNRRCACVSARR
jgi:N-methylhydantoinase B